MVFPMELIWQWSCRMAIPRRYSGVVHKILCDLSEYGPYVYKSNGGSVYIHFRKVRHKMRLSDHNERSRYGYKWQLRFDNGTIDRKKHSRYYKDVDLMVSDFRRSYKTKKDDRSRPYSHRGRKGRRRKSKRSTRRTSQG